MNMRAAIARIVEFKQEGRALQPVILWAARLQATGPAKANILNTCATDALETWRRNALGQHSEISLDDFERELALIISDVAEQDTNCIERAHICLVLGDMPG